MILLHGSMTNSAMLMGNITRLSVDYRVYAVDIISKPGKSDESRPEMKPQNYSNWIMDILSELKIDKVNLVGNSLGGWISLCFATLNPGRVNKLVLISTSGAAPEKKSFLIKVIFFSLFGQSGINRINHMVYGDQAIPDKALEFGNLVSKNFNPRMGGLYIFNDYELKNLTMPTLLIAWKKDVLLPSVKTANRLNKLLDKIEIKMIDDSGHVIINCTEDIINFLKRVL